jgi:ribosomal protein S12 methylthiotransferase
MVEVLIEEVTGDGTYEGRAAHQGPDDGSTTVLAGRQLAPGDLVTAQVVESMGADLVARA